MSQTLMTEKCPSFDEQLRKINSAVVLVSVMPRNKLEKNWIYVSSIGYSQSKLCIRIDYLSNYLNNVNYLKYLSNLVPGETVIAAEYLKELVSLPERKSFFASIFSSQMIPSYLSDIMSLFAINSAATEDFLQVRGPLFANSHLQTRLAYFYLFLSLVSQYVTWRAYTYKSRHSSSQRAGFRTYAWAKLGLFL